MDGGEADWEITRYSGVGHGFTSWESSAYSPKADYRSWQSMLTSMKELMPLEVKDTTNNGTTLEGGDGSNDDPKQDDEDKSDGVGAQFALTALLAAFVNLAI